MKQKYLLSELFRENIRHMTELEKLYWRTGDAPLVLREAHIQSKNNALEVEATSFVYGLLAFVKARLSSPAVQ